MLVGFSRNSGVVCALPNPTWGNKTGLEPEQKLILGAPLGAPVEAHGDIKSFNYNDIILERVLFWAPSPLKWQKTQDFLRLESFGGT